MISGVFGIQGEVRLFLYNLDTELFDRPRRLTLACPPDGVRRDVRLTARAGTGKRVLGRIDGVGSANEAEALVGAELLVPRTALPALPDGEWYHADLLGAEVSTVSGRLLGTLTEIHSTGSVDVWEVHGAEGDWYVPALLELIVRVDPGVAVVVKDAAAQEAL